MGPQGTPQGEPGKTEKVVSLVHQDTGGWSSPSWAVRWVQVAVGRWGCPRPAVDPAEGAADPWLASLLWGRRQLLCQEAPGRHLPGGLFPKVGLALAGVCVAAPRYGLRTGTSFTVTASLQGVRGHF